MADLTTVIHETISGVKIVKAFGMEKFENQKFVNETNGLRRIFFLALSFIIMAIPKY